MPNTFDMDTEFKIGDEIEHRENTGLFGIIRNIDENLMGYETYFIQWENSYYMKFQWTSRIKRRVYKEAASNVCFKR